MGNASERLRSYSTNELQRPDVERYRQAATEGQPAAVCELELRICELADYITRQERRSPEPTLPEGWTDIGKTGMSERVAYAVHDDGRSVEVFCDEKGLWFVADGADAGAVAWALHHAALGKKDNGQGTQEAATPSA